MASVGVQAWREQFSGPPDRACTTTASHYGYPVAPPAVLHAPHPPVAVAPSATFPEDRSLWMTPQGAYRVSAADILDRLPAPTPILLHPSDPSVVCSSAPSGSAWRFTPSAPPAARSVQMAYQPPPRRPAAPAVATGWMVSDSSSSVDFPTDRRVVAEPSMGLKYAPGAVHWSLPAAGERHATATVMASPPQVLSPPLAASASTLAPTAILPGMLPRESFRTQLRQIRAATFPDEEAFYDEIAVAVDRMMGSVVSAVAAAAGNQDAANPTATQPRGRTVRREGADHYARQAAGSGGRSASCVPTLSRL